MKIWIRRLVPLSVALLILAGVVYGFWPRPVEVDLGTVSRGPMRVTVDEEGKTRVRERYVVSAPLNGSLLRTPLKAGSPVEAGKTVVATIDPVDPSILNPREKAVALEQVSAAEAAREQAKTRVEVARREYELAVALLDRVRKSHATGVASADDLQVAESREQVRAEEVRTAQAAERVAAFNLLVAKAGLIEGDPKSALPNNGRREILSPIDGVVLKVFQESAAVVAPGNPILTLGDPSDLEVVIDVLSTDAVRIAPGNKVVIERWGGDHPLAGRVRLVEPSARTKVSALGVEEQRVYVVADFLDPLEKRARLGDEYRIDARVVVWESADVVRVPAGALFRAPGGEWAVFAVRDGVARVTPVRVGHSNGFEAEVLDGLAPGDVVVLHPSDRVKEGVAVAGR